ncbi:hypothetical protein CRG98_037075 [Punica granatum]|uniref:Uncharacterized protein n=1 Tax=Punica granatum TaxID=22663 RepID=A0A2I0IF06_PUNGR|nr:hypothetical protein CRG98_037075 [Punica granatum]
MTVTYKDWHEMLHFALLAYRTSIRTSTRAIPYSLVYGMEVVLPIEVEIPSMRVLAESELEEAEWAKQRYEQLNLIDEKRLTALCHGQCYQQRMARAFNARVYHREFNPGDLVLRKPLYVIAGYEPHFRHLSPSVLFRLHTHVASAHSVISTCTLSIYDHL